MMSLVSEVLDRSQRISLWSIGGLYAVQGIPLGLGAEAIPTLLRDAGAPLASLAWLPLMNLPWIFNLFWAPRVDNLWSARIGKRRSWVLPMQLGIAAGLFTLAFLPFRSEFISEIIIVGTLIACCAATQDIATDGLVADRVAASELGGANAFQVAGMAVGMIIGGAGVLIGERYLGQTVALLALATVVLAFLLPVVFWSESSAVKGNRQRRARLRQFFSRRFAVQVLALGLLGSLTAVTFQSLWRLILVDAGWAPDRLGGISAVAQGALMVLGSFMALVLIRRLGERKTGLMGIAIVALSGSGWMLITLAWADDTLALSVFLIAALAIGGSLASVAIFAVVMRFAQAGSQAATDFTVFQSSHVLTTILVSSLAIALAGQLSYAAAIAVGITLCAAGGISLLVANDSLFSGTNAHAD